MLLVILTRLAACVQRTVLKS